MLGNFKYRYICVKIIQGSFLKPANTSQHKVLTSPHDQLVLQQVLQTAPDGIKWTTVASAAGASHGFNPPMLMQWLRVRLGCWSLVVPASGVGDGFEKPCGVSCRLHNIDIQV